jgi:tetratricopeptide (TPR) repeat protein
MGRMTWCIGLLLCCGGSWLLAQAPVSPETEETPAKETHIKQLIEQLGAADFVTREAAEQSLEKLGAETFEALEEAQNHSDLEIAMRAQYLLRKFRVTILDTDPPMVRNLLKNYATQKDSSQRLAVLQQLFMLPDRSGWPAICRLVRLEQNEAISKQAALVIVTQRVSSDTDVSLLVASLPTPLVSGKRGALEWLRTFKLLLQDRPAATNTWERLVAEEFAHLKDNPSRTSEEVVTQLARWHVEQLCAQKLESQAAPWLERLLSLREHGSVEEFEEHIDWICHLQMWSVLEQLEKKFATKFAANALLKYRLAEAKLKLGDPTTATTLAEAAFAMRAKSQADHELAGNALMERGLFEWSEREFRHVLKLADRGSEYEIRTRTLLSEMLHDQAQEQAAGTVIKEFLDYLATDEKARGILERGSRSEEMIRSRMNLFFGLAAMEMHDYEKAEELLRESYNDDSDNVDALIHLFRLPAPSEEGRRQMVANLRDATRQYQESILEMQQELAEADNPNTEQYYKLQLARLYNDYSWLVSNTEGDFDGAIRSSLESLKLRPGTAAYMDTLGRAYYAKGDLTNAIKSQSEALRLEPHSGMMQRQLALFQTAAKKQQQPEEKK